ncbi:MAG: FCD domain-containing protein [Desulfosarcinaceae bacterium]|nr:FCD domain-containing protein [Desulfosarcinaceae bacterium]
MANDARYGGPNKMLALEKIRILLANHPRNLLLFEMAVLTQATIPALLSLRVSDLRPLKVGDLLPLAPENSAPKNTLLFTHTMKSSFDRLVLETNPNDTDFIFKSKKGDRPLSQTSVSRIFRKWIAESGVTGYRGLRELRSGVHAGRAADSSPAEDSSESGHSLPKIATLSRQEAVFQELEKAIISGKIPPGQKLITEDIARQMGVSRIPVREAMGRLEARGFIRTRPNWGSIVNELSRENLKEILDLRLMLECEAVAKAAPLVSEATIRQLAAAHNQFANARAENDADRLLGANREFHFLAYQDSNAPVLLNLIKQLWDRVSPYYHIMFRQSLAPHPTVGVDYHDHIVAAMRERNAEAAKHWLKADLIRSAEFVLELFDLHQKRISINSKN